MPLDAAIRTQLVSSMEQYEKRVPHLYLDSKGKATIGVGHLVDTKSVVEGGPKEVIGALRALKLQHVNPETKKPDRDATDAELMAEYERVKKIPEKRQKPHKKLAAAAYESDDMLVMPDDEINKQRDAHIGSFHDELRARYKKEKGYPADFDDLPQDVRLALFDMIFNLGGKTFFEQFKNFDAALQAGAWDRAAVESHRPDVQNERNAYVFYKLRGSFVGPMPADAPTPRTRESDAAAKAARAAATAASAPATATGSAPAPRPGK